MPSSPASIYRSDCRYFRGDIPCRPHKEDGYHCVDCPVYLPRKGRILIIKLGAIGDVIRTTPLLHKIASEYPGHSVWWLTNTPEILPSSVDKSFTYNIESIQVLQATEYDILINLDKDPHACALAGSLKAGMKFGFVLSDGKPSPANNLAEHKFLTGIFDDLNKSNDKHYIQEIFGICGWEYSGEEYILEFDPEAGPKIELGSRPVIGLNTGCGSRWVSRLWSEDNWRRLIESITANGYTPLLLGGEQEHEKNSRLADSTGALYAGYFSLGDFIALVNRCHVVVTAVTMGLHIAIGLKKRVVLMNNIFNPREFELYGRGEIIQPDLECRCFFSPKCRNEEYFCMDHLPVDKIMEAVSRQASSL